MTNEKRIYQKIIYIYIYILKKTNKQTKNLKCLAKEIYKFLHGLSPPIMNNIFKVRGNIYNVRNFQSLYSNCQKTVRFGTKTITYRGPQIWTLIPNNM